MVEDPEARFERMFRENGALVRGYALRRAGSDVADEVLSEVFVVAWRRLDEIPARELPWLLGCARRVLANQRRGVLRRQALVERLTQSARAPSGPGGEESERLQRALAGLREADREVLMLIAWEDLSIAEASVVMGCSERAFSMRLHRARQKLATELGERQSWAGNAEVADG